MQGEYPHKELTSRQTMRQCERLNVSCALDLFIGHVFLSPYCKILVTQFHVDYLCLLKFSKNQKYDTKTHLLFIVSIADTNWIEVDAERICSL